jgi:hypothetical protein
METKMEDNIDYTPYKNFFDIIGKDRKNIVIIENFIESEDLALINNFLNKYRDDDEFMGGKDLREKEVRKVDPVVANMLDKYEHKTFKVIKEMFIDGYGIPVKRIPFNPVHFIKWIPGMNSKEHADCEKPDGTPAWTADFYKYNISVLMYPNNDYTGGEIIFPEYNLTFKPQPGSFILFPGNNNYKHIVNRVDSGVRYTMPSWYSFDVKEKARAEKKYSYRDSVQLWEGLPDFDKIDPVGIDVKGKTFDN